MKLSVSLVVILSLIMMAIVGYSMADGHHKASVAYPMEHGPVRTYVVPGRVEVTRVIRQRPRPGLLSLSGLPLVGSLFAGNGGLLGR